MQTGTNFSESFQTIYEDDRSFLEKTVDDYPASPLSLFLLLQDYKRTGDSRFDDLAKKAAVYFQNPAWLNYQLSGDELMKADPEDDISEEESTIQDTEDQLQPTDTEEYPQPENEIENILTPSPENMVEEEAIHEMEQEEKVEFVQGEEIADFEESFVENETKEDTILEDTPAEEEKSSEDQQVESEKADPTESRQDIDTLEETIPDTDSPSASEETHHSVSADSGSEEPPISNEEENLPEPPTLAPETDVEKEEENQELEFEPLHTIDYFASQGIIIKEEALMDDKLGKQVKSFTDWLKSMKKLHPGRLPEQNEVVERIIQSSAELSNEDAGILTESMAEVLIKQGKKSKAIEMFEKLSLMNPSKSTYFAAKIESLKNK